MGRAAELGVRARRPGSGVRGRIAGLHGCVHGAAVRRALRHSGRRRAYAFQRLWGMCGGIVPQAR